MLAQTLALLGASPDLPPKRLLNQPGMTGNVSIRWWSVVRA